MMDLHMFRCEASESAAVGLKTMALDFGGLEKFASLAVFIPRREINWLETFARRGWRHEDYELSEVANLRYQFERKALARCVTPDTVSFYKDAPGFSSAVLQGDLITYSLSEPFLCYDTVCSEIGTVSAEYESQFVNGTVTTIADLDAAKDLCEKLDKPSRQSYRTDVIEPWNSKSFLLVEPVIFF
jgi:hypothetical protein